MAAAVLASQRRQNATAVVPVAGGAAEDDGGEEDGGRFAADETARAQSAWSVAGPPPAQPPAPPPPAGKEEPPPSKREAAPPPPAVRPLTAAPAAPVPLATLARQCALRCAKGVVRRPAYGNWMGMTIDVVLLLALCFYTFAVSFGPGLGTTRDKLLSLGDTKWDAARFIYRSLPN